MDERAFSERRRGIIMKDSGMNKNTVIAKRGVLLLLVFVFVCMSAIILRIGYLAVIKGEEYREKAEAQQLSVTTLNATRGTIYDCNMNVLAQSASVWLVYINPSKVTDENRELVISGLSEILDLDAQELRADIEKNASYGYLKIKGKIEYADKTALSQYVYDNKLGGVICIDPDTKRYYPNGALASTVLGFTGSDGNGLYGLEFYYDDELTGTDGRIVTAKDGKQTELDNAYEATYDAIQGTNIVLTIDSEIQAILSDALNTALVETGAKNVYGMVMNTKTGAILAQSNLPDYDPNSPYEITDEALLKSIEELDSEEEKSVAEADARFSQWKNKSISDFYEPGSVFKVFLVSAALEEGVINDSTSYNCVGTTKIADRTIKDYNPTGHGLETPRTLLVNSCNTFSVFVGQKLGVDLFYKYFQAFGFTEKTGVDLPGEGAPVANVTYHDPEISFSVSDLASSSFGQSISVTPLQIITAISAVGNGGHLMQPYIVAKKVDASGNTISETQPTEKRQVISESTTALVSSYMEDVVKGGTGKNAYVAGARIAGKTGTSEKLGSEENAYIASFAGFAPCDDPEISVIIIIDEPSGANYSGGVIAAPVAGEVFEKTLRYLGIEPSYTEDELSSLSVPTPDLLGLDISEAEAQLKSVGHTVRVIGEGDTVISQSPEAGRTTPANGIVVLYTEENLEKKSAEVPSFTGLTVSQANQLAVNSGFNIKISGSSFTSSEVVAYRQDYEAGSEAELGSVITVYFRTTSGIND